MDCEVSNVKVRVPVGKTGKRFKEQWIFRCRRCDREFPFEAVLNLAGCGALARMSRDERENTPSGSNETRPATS